MQKLRMKKMMNLSTNTEKAENTEAEKEEVDEPSRMKIYESIKKQNIYITLFLSKLVSLLKMWNLLHHKRGYEDANRNREHEDGNVGDENIETEAVCGKYSEKNLDLVCVK